MRGWMHRGRRVAAALVALAALPGCPDETQGGGGAPATTTTTATACDLELAWGLRHDGAFVALTDGAEAPVTLGFQGFRFVDGVARVDGTDADRARFRFDAEVDGEAPVTQEAGVFDLKLDPDGARYAESVQLFFNDTPMPELVGKGCRTRVTATIGTCKASEVVDIVLVLGGCQEIPPDAGTVDAGWCDAGTQ